MSVICDVLVYTTINETAAADAVRFDPDDRDQRLAKIDTDKAGGNKFFRGRVFAAALNYVTPVKAEAAIAAAEWRDPAHTIVVIDGDDYGVKPYAKTVEQIRREL